MSTENRLLDPSKLPSSLWDPVSGILSLSPGLARAYEAVVDQNGLRQLSNERDLSNPPVGGVDQQRTNEHFAQAFDGSSARAQLALLDPKSEVPGSSNAFVVSMAGNDICITDAPCGAGAAGLSFLATIAELRAQKVLPRERLGVTLIGAELSQPARRYADQVLTALRPFLEEQSIFVDASWQEWDVTCQLSNTDLVQRMTLKSDGKAKRLLIVANFNAFLEKDRRRKDAQPQLAELFRHSSGTNSLAVWIEPAMNRAINGIFPWLSALLAGAWRFFAKESHDAETEKPIATSQAHFRLPLSPAETARVGLAVMAIELIRSK